jgi:hypothetical protein
VVNVTELINVNKEVIGVFDFLGRYLQKEIAGLEPNNLYLIRYNDGSTQKVFLR